MKISLLISIGFSQPDTLWTKVFSGNVIANGESVEQTSDGGFIITGRVSDVEYTNNIWLIKTDSNGDTLWTNRYFPSGSSSGRSVIQTNDGGYIIAGSHNISPINLPNGIIIKTNSFGDTLWTKSFGIYENDEALSDIIQISDGGYLLVGTIWTSSVDTDIWILKINSSGDTLWTRTYGISTMSESGSSVIESSSGDFIITGMTYDNNRDIVLIKIDTNGNIVWNKQIGTGEPDQGYDVVELPDGSIAIAGYTNSGGSGSSDVWLLKRNSSGDELWTKTFGGEYSDYGYSIDNTFDGGLIITGRIEPGNDDISDAYIIKTDTLGNLDWEKKIGGSDRDYGWSVKQLSDSGYVIVGETKRDGGYGSVYLIRLEKDPVKPNSTVYVTNVSSPVTDGTFNVGQIIPITITFNETVSVTGVPKLTLETGTIDAVVDYTSGSGTNMLTFNYTVASGHTSSDLDYISTTALSLNNGTVKDAAGNNAILTLPEPGKVSAWETVGIAGFSAGSSYHHSLVIANGIPYVAFEDYGNGRGATVMKYNGSSWENVGSAGFSAGEVIYTSLAVNNYTPYVAFKDYANGEKSTVMKYNGNSWVTVGNAGFSAGKVEFTSLAFNNNTPYIAYSDESNSYNATVMKYDGNSWVTVGNAGFSAGRVNHTFLAINNGIPYVVYQDFANSDKATVMKYDDGSWVTVGSAGSSVGTAWYTSLAFDNITPYISYMDWGLNRDATVLKYDGSNWINVGNAGFSDGYILHTSLVINSGTPYVAYRDDENSFKATVMKYDGTLWVPVGIEGFSAGQIGYPSLASANGSLYLAYNDEANGTKATVKKIDLGTSLGVKKNIVINLFTTYTVSTDGTSDFTTIQAGIDAASDGDMVLVNPGTYLEHINFNGKNIVVESLFVTTQDTSFISSTIINANQSWSVVEFKNGEDSTAVLNGFTITNGNGQGGYGYGGGIYITLSNPVLKNLIISGNTAASEGAGIYCSESILTLKNVRIVSNSSANMGGGIQMVSGRILMENVIIINNYAQTVGGGVNSSGSYSQLDNVTIANNSSPGSGGGIYSAGNDSLYLNNSIVWNNSIITEGGAALVEAKYSDIQGGFSGSGNINADPMFVDSVNGDFNLKWGSPAIDSGDPYSPLDPDSTRADMGAIFYDQIDTIPPILSISSYGYETVGTEDKTTIYWSATDNSSLDSGFIDILYSSGKGVRIKSIMAEAGESTFDIPDSTIGSAHLVVTVLDYKLNEAKDTSAVFTVFDNTPPTLSLIEPDSGKTFTEYDTLLVKWQATDNIKMDSIQVYFVNYDNYTYIGGESNNFTQYKLPIPLCVMDTAQIKLIAQDSTGNKTETVSPYIIVNDNTAPVITLTLSTTMLGIGDGFEITWDGTDNFGIVEIQIDYSFDNGTTYQELSTGEENDGSYTWLVPDNPSDEVNLRLIATDLVGLKDTAEVSGLSIVVVYPTILSVVPEPGFLTWRDNSISIYFSQPIQTDMTLEENVDCDLKYSTETDHIHSYDEENNTLMIDFSPALVALDTISITLNGSTLANTFGYKLDADGDGTPGEDYVLNYNTGMFADFDTSNTIDLIDMALFLNSWEENALTDELGPFTGTPPHLGLIPDGRFNIEDVMGFVLMGNWYMSGGSSLGRWTTFGNDLKIEQELDSLYLAIPQDVVIYEIQVKYDPASLLITEPNVVSTIKLADHNRREGFLTFSANLLGTNELKFPIKFKSKQRNVNITVSHRGVNAEGQIITQWTKDITLKSIPIEFALHQNYPNPFNPITTIEYDLPNEGYVTLTIYDLLGRRIKVLVDNKQSVGYKTIIWNAKNEFGKQVGAGVYLYQLSTKNYVKTRKMILLK